jgi:hypothetical protein
MMTPIRLGNPPTVTFQLVEELKADWKEALEESELLEENKEAVIFSFPNKYNDKKHSPAQAKLACPEG